MASRVFLSPPHMSDQEEIWLREAFASNWIAPLGPFVDRFEQTLGTCLGGLHVCALNSGTSALHLGLLVLGIEPGDRVYCSDFTFSATVNAIRYCGAEPVFIDSETESWQMAPDLLAARLEADARDNRLPRAVLVVDLYGISADYARILPICEQYGVPILEDSAEALGSTYQGRACGTFGHLAAFSFNGNKIITTSGGGALVSSDASLIARARYLSTQAREPRPYYHHTTIGYNYRLSNLLAAVGCGQLSVLPSRVAARRAVNAYYRQALGDIPGLSFMPEPPGAVSNCWLTVIQLDPSQAKLSPEALRLTLEEKNIESRPAWNPMHRQPVFESFECVGGAVCTQIFERGLCLPSGSALDEVTLARVCDAIREALT